jgi:tRNA (mo5U34)-methyltransferase
MDFVEFHKIISKTKISHWRDVLPQTIDELTHGDLKSWLEIFKHLPDTQNITSDLTKDTIQIGNESNLIDITKNQLITELKTLHPWRKGPFDLFSININTEWRSDFKWRRLINHIQP